MYVLINKKKTNYKYLELKNSKYNQKFKQK